MRKEILILFVIGYLFPQEIITTQGTLKQFPGEFFGLSTEFYMPNNYWDMQGQQQDNKLMKTAGSMDYGEDDILNPFAQPGDTLTKAYGSGDVNQDGQVSWDDYNEMVDNSPQNDYADIDGNGVPSEQADKDFLEDFLTEEIDYLPGHWNNLTTTQERIDWADKMLAIDPTDSIPYQSGNVEDRWISGNYSTQIYLNFFGYDGEDIHTKYDSSNIGKFNLPVYKGIQYDPNTGLGHGMNMVLVGEDPTNIYDWAYIEPQSDAIIKIDEGVLSSLSGLRLVPRGIKDFSSNSSPDMPTGIPLIGFEINQEGGWSVYYQDQDLTTSRPQNTPIIEPTLGIGDGKGNIPIDYKLNQNYPNPFNPLTTLRYELPENSFVNITIYDLVGREVKTLVNQTQGAGYKSVIWNATNNNGRPVSAGVYFYQVRVGEFVKTKKMILVK